MSEKTNEPATETTKENAAVEPSSDKTCCKGGSCCKPHTSLTISVIALLLAAYAAFTALSNADTTAVDNRLNDLNSQIAGVNDQLSSLSHEMETNRENLIQTKLKKALQSIQEIGTLAGEETRATITEVEQMLQTLTAVGEQLNTPEQTAEPATEQQAAPEETAPAEISQPAANTEQPAESTNPEVIQPETTPSEPAAASQQPAAGADVADQTAAASDAPQTPATDMPAPTPADNPADGKDATNTLPANTAPPAEPSAPQAF